MKSVFRHMAAAAVLCCGLIAPAWSQYVVGAGASIDMSGGGSWDIGCLPVQVEGSLIIGAGQFSTGSNLDIAGSGVFNGGTGLLQVGGNLSSFGTFNPETGSVVLTDGCIGNTSQLSGTLVFRNLTLSSSTGRTFVIPAGTNITVLGTLTLQGAPGQNIQLISSGGGTAVINLGPGATVNRTFATVAGNVQIGAAVAASSIPTLSEYGLMLLALLMGMAAFWHHRRGATTPHA
ncbi:putative secreted protein (IPTL-CTERM system target) [Acidovorax delafieldii]|uniref:Putative secreted protein (IPTL-CTERM system target) n=1 Tax=Acidovorax delafieldii TaxID=47920 RepID=A0A561XMY8_ACIDE|nr:IPTL-CTERM sorting domain-containing protein [Acidovorax delafieldii]TWG37486.1 putative secreted protein (IPTL-CTERM system target) [Acidovorax delafieldii]